MIQEERCAAIQDGRFGDPRKKFEPVELISTLLEASSVTSGDLIQSLKYPVTCSCNDYGEDYLTHLPLFVVVGAHLFGLDLSFSKLVFCNPRGFWSPVEYLVCFSLDDNLDPHDVDVPADKELEDLERAQLLLFLG